MIQLGFYGAAGEVTGSCYLLTTARARVLIDMGMHQGEKEADEHNRRMPPGNPKDLTAVVLTHAHLDHCGRLPLLTKNGFAGKIHCTAATAELTGIILRDSAHIQEEDCLRFNARLRPGETPCEAPLYETEDAEYVVKHLAPIPYDKTVSVADGITIEFIEAGHILGAASVRMTIEDGGTKKTVIFSGDVGVIGSPILRDPVTPVPGDVVLLESTYGDRDHRSLDATRDEFLQILRESQQSGGKVIIPAFAVGRTQDLVYHIGEFLRTGQLKGLNVYVDSPMATSVSDLYTQHTEIYDEEARALLARHLSPLEFPGLVYTRTVEESKQLNGLKGSMVIISASGMATGGRILHHLRNHLPDPKTHVVIAGYQGQNTLGRRLVDGVRSVRIFREDVPVNATVHTLGGFSAHAGQTELVKWARPFSKSHPRLFLTHGENGPRAALQQRLKSDLGLDSEMPAYGTVVTL